MPEKEPQTGILNQTILRRDLLKSAIALAGGSLTAEACKTSPKIPEFPNQTLNLYPTLLETLLVPDIGPWKKVELGNNRSLIITWLDNTRTQYSLQTGVKSELPAITETNIREQVDTISAEKYLEEGWIWEDKKHIIKDQGEELILYDARSKKPIGKLKPEDLARRSQREREQSQPPILASDDRHVFIALSTIAHWPIFVLNRENNSLRIEDLKNAGLIQQMITVEDILVVRTIRQETVGTGAGPNQPDRACCIDVHRLYVCRVTD